jgi:hypothetical protein
MVFVMPCPIATVATIVLSPFRRSFGLLSLISWPMGFRLVADTVAKNSFPDGD